MIPEAGLKTPLHRDDWTTSRLKYLLERKRRDLRPDDGVVTAFRDGVVTLRSNRREDGFTFADKEIGYQGVEPGDLVIHAMDGFAGAIGVSDSRGKCSPVYTITVPRPNAQAHTRFWAYYLRNLAVTGFIESLAKGIRERSTDFRWNDAGNLLVNFPDRDTQKTIADFLDRETARIGQLIQKKQEFVSGVEEEFLDRTTLLVTAGLDRSATTKSSGHEWQPTVPSHWTVTRLKFLCERIVDCLHETPEHIEDGEYPSIRTSDVIRGAVKVETAKLVSAREYQHRIQRLEPREGDILYTREGERFGLAALVPPSTKLCLGQRMMMFRANKRVFNSYLMWSLNGKFAYNFLKQDVTGATSPHLNIFDIRNVPIFLPPLDEQKKISSVLDEYFSKKEDLVAKTALTIDGLKEYQAALITAAVTGQIDVATWVTKGNTDRRLDQIEEDMALREARA